MAIPDATPSDGPDLRWLVCERDRRWVSALRRFVPEMMPIGSWASIRSVEPSEIASLARSAPPTIVLWEARRERLGDVAQEIMRLERVPAIGSNLPGVTSLVAAIDLTDREYLSLLELGVASIVRRPEELPRLAPLVRGTFAHSTQRLD